MFTTITRDHGGQGLHVIITGGAGFIGSNVSAALLRDGQRVTVFDSLARPGSERNLEWLQTLAPPGHLRFVRGDVRDIDAVRNVVAVRDADIVFHFAAQTAVTSSLVQPREDLEVNVCRHAQRARGGPHQRSSHPADALLHIDEQGLRYAGTSTHHRIVLPASGFCDAAIDARGIDESEPLDFHSPYGCSKGAADQYVHDYARIYGLRTVVFRMSCVYGPRQFGNEDQGWVAHFMRAVAEDRPLTIYGNGKQVRDLLYVDDLVRAFKLAALRIEQTSRQGLQHGGWSSECGLDLAGVAAKTGVPGRAAAIRPLERLAPRRSADLRERHVQGAA